MKQDNTRLLHAYRTIAFTLIQIHKSNQKGRT